MKRRSLHISHKIIKSGCFFLIALYIMGLAVADNNVPPLLAKPGDNKETQKPVNAEVVAVKTKNAPASNSENPEKNSNDSEMIQGNSAISFIVKNLGIKDYDVIYNDKKTLTMDNPVELYFPVKEGLDFYVLPQKIESSEVFTLNTRVQIAEGDNKIDAIKAIAKARMNEPLVYKGIQTNGDSYIIVLTISSEGDNQQQGGQQDNKDEQDKKDEQQQKDNEQDKQNLEEQKQQPEQKKDGEEKKEGENQQTKIILESLDEMDQKEQKEMLNDRERITLPDKWW